MKIDLNTIVIVAAIILGAWIIRPPKPTDALNNHLLNENKALHDTIINREREINQIKIDVIKSHENEKEILRNIDTATIDQLDSTWSRFFDKYSD